MLYRLGGTRLVHLNASDAPRVARALLDAKQGLARVTSGVMGHVPYLLLERPGIYSVAIRGDDWQKIYPFFRYEKTAYTAVQPPTLEPDPIPNPHRPDRVMKVPRVNPGPGLHSVLEALPYDDYVTVQQLLSANRTNENPVRLDKRAGGVSTKPPRHDLDGLYGEGYNRWVTLLEQLFPKDFP